MRFNSFIFCVVTAVAGAALHAAPAPVSAEASVLPKGTSIVLRLETDLQSGRDKAGKTVLFSVNQNVYGKGHVLLLEKGAAARGHVSESDGRGSLGRAGTLKFTCDYVLTDNGAQIPMNLVVTLRPSGRTGNGSDSEVAASVSTGGHSYPNEGAAVDEYYRNRFADGVPPDDHGSGFGPDDDYYGGPARRWGSALIQGACWEMGRMRRQSEARSTRRLSPPIRLSLRLHLLRFLPSRCSR